MNLNLACAAGISNACPRQRLDTPPQLSRSRGCCNVVVVEAQSFGHCIGEARELLIRGRTANLRLKIEFCL